MTVQNVRIFGDPVLRTAADPVVDFDKELRHLVDDLLETMGEQSGTGLAAFPELNPNPVLEFPDDEEQDGPEGCLSIPGVYVDTKRRQNVIAKGFNEFGDPMQIVGTGLMARCLQHETDHLDGVIFIDRLDTTGRKQALKEIRRAEWYDPTNTRVKLSPHAAPSPFGLGR